jgi:chromosomal replication initiation ATPase DnaA
MVLGGRINPDLPSTPFVEGKSNQLAKAAAIQVAGNPGGPTTPCSFTVASVWERPI